MLYIEWCTLFFFFHFLRIVSTLGRFISLILWHVTLETVQLVFKFPILLFKFTNKMIFLFCILSSWFLDLDKFDIFLIELNFFVCFELFLFEFFYDSLNFVVFHGHEFELLFIELNFGEKLVTFLFLKFLILVDVLIFSLKSVVFLD